MWGVHPPIVCITFKVGLNECVLIILIIPSGFCCTDSLIYLIISVSDFPPSSKLFRSLLDLSNKQL